MIVPSSPRSFNWSLATWFSKQHFVRLFCYRCAYYIQFPEIMKNENNRKKGRKEGRKKKDLAQYKQKWLKHVSRVEDITYPKQIFDYCLTGR